MTRWIYVVTLLLLRTAFWRFPLTSIPSFFKLVGETWTIWPKQPSLLMHMAMMKLISSMSVCFYNNRCHSHPTVFLFTDILICYVAVDVQAQK